MTPLEFYIKYVWHFLISELPMTLVAAAYWLLVFCIIPSIPFFRRKEDITFEFENKSTIQK